METIYRKQKNSYLLQAVTEDSENFTRINTNPNSEDYETIFEGQSHFDMLKEILIRLNDNDLIVTKIFFRIITPDNKVLNF